MDVNDEALGRTARRATAAGPQFGVDPSWIDQAIAAVRPSLAVDQVATAQNITGIRRGFAAWLALDVAAGDLFDDLVLAVYEALANVADHAYADAPDGVGKVRLLAHRSPESLRITVSDDGLWRAATGAPFRNRGLAVIRLLISQVHIETTRSGTVVHLQCVLPGPEQSA